MSKVCPVCNELTMITFNCSKCGNIMVDKGRVQEYMDPYGPQMPIDDRENYCLHLFQCLKCKNMERKRIEKVKI
ncbi:hypothetical protein BD780_002998 [Clostridium tetanomorphum]|uniref:Uncharacterized protein n=1 Tax=Clostridium tetanomorphum TaxID=1553 RepID=A0A923E8S1_CLOTT|nr:hypothetical protein [Clostridium tetanomorphum]KAJ53665.1 hypothetical protein CTM_00310 [Clostridium tetanomorphum DSM 665]MBC2397174.1 hypothetical protein [Clostridium tetanomorphum]MBP1862387.1 hypothetical protein [Clostridium tetanomorphum]NRS85773.1 hypothetical protein [Clostridium tetanomorphum]NRZ96218.1 hypothetical protein [Clostridium tetanomorphum]